MTEKLIWVVVPAAGVGSRLKSAGPKQYIQIGGRTLLDHTLSVLLDHPRVAGAVVAVSSTDQHWENSAYANHSNIRVVDGGVERCDSVMNGLRYLHEQEKVEGAVMVHDAARPCLQAQDIDALIDVGAQSASGAILAVPVKDTLKQVGTNHEILRTVDRSELWHALTPQLFPIEGLIAALDSANSQGMVVTDEASAMEQAGVTPLIVPGLATNLKVTVAEDLLLTEAILISQGRIAL